MQRKALFPTLLGVVRFVNYGKYQYKNIQSEMVIFREGSSLTFGTTLPFSPDKCVTIWHSEHKGMAVWRVGL